MSRYLSELLGEDVATLRIRIRDLERHSGRPAADIRLAAYIKDLVRIKAGELGLDPHDTSEQELYHALVGLAGLHDKFLDKALGGKGDADVQDLLPRMKAKAEEFSKNQQVCAMKPAAFKRIIKKMPPKKLMKKLGYKSVDSFLKREKPPAILAGMRCIEASTWLDKFMKQYRSLTPHDFENKPIEILMPNSERWREVTREYVQREGQIVMALIELGAVVILPLPVRQLPGICIVVMPLLLHAVNMLKLYSSFFKYSQVRPNFADIFAGSVMNSSADAASFAGQKIDWRVVQRHFGRQKTLSQLDIFGPHVQLDDLQWHHPEDLLYRIEPALKFWQGLNYVGVPHGDRPVSFNLFDAALNYCNRLPFMSHVSRGLQANLKDELLVRYMAERSVESNIINQIDKSNDDYTGYSSLANG